MRAQKTLDISRLSHQGEGIAFDEEHTWFVARALPGEQVLAQQIQTRGRNVFGRCVEVLRAAPERIPAHCEHAQVCGGCDLQHLSPDAQRQHKALAISDQLARLGKLDTCELTEPPITGEPWGYRERVRFVLERQAERVHLAYRAPGSASPMRLRNCPVLHPELEAALPRVADWASRCPPGALQKELKLAIGADGRVGIAVDGHGDVADFEGPVVDARGRPLNQHPPLHYHSLNGLRLEYTAADFSQVNAELNRRVSERLLHWLAPEGQRVLELFCGVGNFSLALAQAAADVQAVDSQRQQLERAEQNALLNNLHNVRFTRADLYKRVSLDLDPHTLVLVDPPRAGLGELCKPLLKAKPRRIAYLSCDSASFAKDAGKLVRGGYRLSRLSYVDFFAQTGNIETMGLFEC